MAILGHRGIPNSYGGFESFVEKISEGLVGLGVAVTVYCRTQYFKERPVEYKGARLIYLKTITNKAFDTFVHTFLSVFHSLFTNSADVLIIVNVGNAPFALLARLFGKKVILCVDGMDWERKKWGRLARVYLKLCSHLARFAAHKIVTDAASVQEFYKTQRQTPSRMIPYGTDIETAATDPAVLKALGLEEKKYFVYVARFEPENNPLLVVEAYARSGSKFPLVMIGGNRYNPELVRQIKAAANRQVFFLGYVFGARYKALLRGALAYIRAAEVGGLSPAVIEAMGKGVCVIANDKPENRQPLADSGLFYSLNALSLAGAIASISAHPERALELGKKAAERALIMYNWDRISYDYYSLIQEITHADIKISETTPARPPAAGKILLTGAGGMLGRALYQELSRNNSYVVRASTLHPTDRWQTKLDITKYDEYAAAVAEFRPDYIIHAAALTDLEVCEKNLVTAYTVNTLSVKYAAQLAARSGAQLVYFSTSNIFNGQQESYRESDEAHPVNVYGLTKYMGEMMANYYAPNHLTIRLGWLMGGGPQYDKKFVAKIIAQIVAGKPEIHALKDTFGTISYTRDVVKNLVSLLAYGASGTYHMASVGCPSRAEVAKEIVNILGYHDQVRIQPVTTEFFSSAYSTQRSLYECLVNDRLTQDGLNQMRPWQEALCDYLTRDWQYAFFQPDASALKKPRLANNAS